MVEGINWGYIRVSTLEQNLDRQIAALNEFGIDDRHIKVDKLSGKNFDRPGFLSLIGTDKVAPSMREGDCLVLLSLDRLGRNYTEIRNMWKYITDDMGCDIIVLDMPLLNTKQTGNSLDRRFMADLVLQILSYVAEKERLSMLERQRGGIKAAHLKGVKFGRKPIPKPESFDLVAKQWQSGGITAVRAMKALGLKKNTFYKMLKNGGYIKENA